MPKIKLSVKELKRLSKILEKEIDQNFKQTNKELTKVFVNKKRIESLEKDLENLNEMKGIFDKTISNG